MPGTMSQADLIVDLKASIHDAAAVFTSALDADFIRHLNVAAFDFGRYRRRTLVGTLSLVANLPNYPAPADLIDAKFALWGTSQQRNRTPWSTNHPGRLPTLRLFENDGVRELWIDPEPDSAQISDWGKTYRYYYYAAHAIGATPAETTVHIGDRGLLLLRAQAEAMREIAIRNSAKPITMQNAMSGTSRNSTPAALYQELMAEFEKAVA